MVKTAQFVLLIAGAVVLTGILLDEAGKGTFGDQVKFLAKKSTAGFGQGA